ncbi:hypothetical protein F66182_4836 [Fusarium sp. NRRL 66182]|nr:hypothetical protein F66182_4836 [Fusarium sp. NRRL 66182]
MAHRWVVSLIVALGFFLLASTVVGIYFGLVAKQLLDDPDLSQYPTNITPSSLYVPVDHFPDESIYEPHSDDSFALRYWFDAQYYRKGGPVIIVPAGERPGENTIRLLSHGIVQELAKATGGIGVVLEHRYYGKSFPVPDLEAKNMRFLSTEQALADMAYFAEHVQFPGLQEHNLAPFNTPYIIYGEYYEAVRRFAPADCASTTQKFIQGIDNILLHGDEDQKDKLKSVFGLTGLRDDAFASSISLGIQGFQSNHWHPNAFSINFGVYCGIVTSDDILFSHTRHLAPFVRDWLSVHKHEENLLHRSLNYIGYVRSILQNFRQTRCKNKTLDECYSVRGFSNETGLDQGPERAWMYQQCSEWGFFKTGSGVPIHQSPLISRLVDLWYLTTPCRESFNIVEPPRVESINKLGGWNFRFPRVAFVSGEHDPWRAATPHRIGHAPRPSTVSEPSILLDGGGHGWEAALQPEGIEFGLPLPAVADAQRKIVEFTQAWLEESYRHRGSQLAVDG